MGDAPPCWGARPRAKGGIHGTRPRAPEPWLRRRTQRLRRGSAGVAGWPTREPIGGRRATAHVGEAVDFQVGNSSTHTHPSRRRMPGMRLPDPPRHRGARAESQWPSNRVRLDVLSWPDRVMLSQGRYVLRQNLAAACPLSSPSVPSPADSPSLSEALPTPPSHTSRCSPNAKPAASDLEREGHTKQAPQTHPIHFLPPTPVPHKHGSGGVPIRRARLTRNPLDEGNRPPQTPIFTQGHRRGVGGGSGGTARCFSQSAPHPPRARERAPLRYVCAGARGHGGWCSPRSFPPLLH